MLRADRSLESRVRENRTHGSMRRREGPGDQSASPCGNLNLPPTLAMARVRYDWGAIRRFYEAGHTVRECVERFGFSNGAWRRSGAKVVV